MVPVKFRCYRCSQLLGVSPSKIGAVVACPKCSADLVVPDPDRPDPDDDSPDDPRYVSPEPRTGALDTGVALDFLDIRPEDIRVEPGATAAVAPELRQAMDLGPIEAAPAVDPEPPSPVVAPTMPMVAPIRVQEPLSRRDPVVTRSRDLTIPRSVVASWSLFVLLALTSAFFAGLLAGHYVWRVH